MTSRGNDRERQTEPRRDRARAANDLYLDILSFHTWNIHATRYDKCRFQVASRNDLKYKDSFFVPVKRTLICTTLHNSGPQSKTDLNKKKYDIFVNCNLVATRWQQYSTHLHTNNTQNDTKQTVRRAIFSRSDFSIHFSLPLFPPLFLVIIFFSTYL